MLENLRGELNLYWLELEVLIISGRCRENIKFFSPRHLVKAYKQNHRLRDRMTLEAYNPFLLRMQIQGLAEEMMPSPGYTVNWDKDLCFDTGP